MLRRRDRSKSKSSRRLKCEPLEKRYLMTATIGNNIGVGDELQNFRLAVATTAEYTAFFGGENQAFAAVQDTVDRINAIFEKELSIRLELVSNTRSIFTDPVTDGFTNGNLVQMINVNTGILNGLYPDGSESEFDIGHVFGTVPSGGSGLAGLGVVNSPVSRGLGGSAFANPTGPSFINLVAHEFAHQFGAAHTFNANQFGSAIGNRSASSAYEPASGTTLLSYAGISADANGNDNLQSSPDDYLHSASFEAIQNFIAGPGTPASLIATGNSIPTIDAGADFVIPASTPFELDATGSDADVDDILTYNWEQLDRGPAMSLPIFDNGSSPLFRSFVPDTESSRVFPRLSDLVDNVNTAAIGEALPTTNRTLNFRATVRDGNNGVNSDDVLVSVVNTGASFRVTAPNTGVNWTGGDSQNVTWAVAGTTANGINAANVAIDLSVDGGLTYPFNLVDSTPNDGSHSLTVPNIDTTEARIRVRAVGNVFFDISDQDFTITSNSAVAGVSVVETGDGTLVAEDGVVGSTGVDQYSVALNTVPSGAVEVTVTADSQTEVSSDNINFGPTATLSFTDTSAQNVFVRGLDDTDVEGIHDGIVVHSITSSSDPNYTTSTLINLVDVVIADDEIQPVIGVDFDEPTGASPENWTRLSQVFGGFTSNLIREDGAATSVGLNLGVSGSAGLNPSDPGSVPLHTPDLFNLTGNHIANNSLTLTWSGLNVGQEYNVYLLTAENFGNNFRQEITILGGGTNPAPFIQDTASIGNALLVNGGLASSTRTLAEDAIVAEADSSGQIRIEVVDIGNSFAILSGAGIQAVTPPTPIDFGDAPAPYPTLLADNGASHIAVGPQLGASRDSESDGVASADADGDDLDGADDEDGVLFGSIGADSTVAALELELTNATLGIVDAWIDFNADGDWDDAGEQILASVNVDQGVQILTYTVPSGITVGDTFARVRVSSAGGLAPTGAASDGEVEDYQLTIDANQADTQVLATSINGASPQRSQLTSLEFTFNQTVQVPSDAITLRHRGDDQFITDFAVETVENAGITTIIVTPTPGPYTEERGDEDSFIDGNYELTIDSSRVFGIGNGPNPMLADFVIGSQEADNVFRFFGDSDGDRDNDIQDLAAFGDTFRLTGADALFDTIFDSENDGDVDISDLGEFSSRFRQVLGFS